MNQLQGEITGVMTAQNSFDELQDRLMKDVLRNPDDFTRPQASASFFAVMEIMLMMVVIPFSWVHRNIS